jgi:hypothetical protein
MLLFAQTIILFYSPHLREYLTYSFVLNGAVFIELFTIYYTITASGADKKKQTLDSFRFRASPCSSTGTRHLRRRGLGQTHENRGDIEEDPPHSKKIALQK